MNIVVQKYGGSSVEDIEKIKDVARRVINEKEKGNEVVVVVSAMGKTTDNLINMSRKICNNPNKRELDMLLSTGEQISISLLSMALEAEGYKSISLTGFQAGIKTKGLHTKNKISDIHCEKIKKYLQEHKIIVVAGFQGINEKGDITTLGRGGSDTTAVALAAKLRCPCEIYTDVDGIYSIDPRVCKDAKKIDFISYEEMMEMASLGANVMDVRAVEIGYKYNVPIYVGLNKGNVKGTWIKENDGLIEERVITGVTISENNLMITINNVLFRSNNIANIFERLAENFINIDMISQTAPVNGHVNISFTVKDEDLDIIKDIMINIKDKMPDINMSIESNITKVSVIGIGMMNQSGVTAKLFKIFAENNIEFKQVTTSEISISFAIDSKEKKKTVNILAKELNL